MSTDEATLFEVRQLSHNKTQLRKSIVTTHSNPSDSTQIEEDQEPNTTEAANTTLNNNDSLNESDEEDEQRARLGVFQLDIPTSDIELTLHHEDLLRVDTPNNKSTATVDTTAFYKDIQGDKEFTTEHNSQVNHKSSMKDRVLRAFHIKTDKSDASEEDINEELTQKINFYDLEAKTYKGEDFKFREELNGKLVLVTNIATFCGLSFQIKGLDYLHKKYKDHGLVVLGFPSNSFMQEPFTGEKQYKVCNKLYGVSFPLMERVSVNGKKQSEVWKYLKDKKKGFLGLKTVKWNFEKFLVDRDGEIMGRYSPFQLSRGTIEPFIRDYLIKEGTLEPETEEEKASLEEYIKLQEEEVQKLWNNEKPTEKVEVKEIKEKKSSKDKDDKNSDESPEAKDC